MVVLKSTNSVQSSDMCQPAAEFGRKPDSDPDDELKWEDIYDTSSVDLTSTLLDMYDTMIAKNSANSPLLSPTNRRQPTPPPPSNQTLAVKVQEGASTPPCDPGGCPMVTSGKLHAKHANGSSNHRPSRLYSKRSYSESVFEEKKRPLSTSSVSSSSSSSSSSLPRNGLDVKKSYLASIESLDDDDHFGNENCPSSSISSVPDHSHRAVQGLSSYTTGTASCKPRWCDPNLSHTDRVLLEIVDTEKTYVRDLDEIIQGYLRHIKQMMHPKISQQCLGELFSNIEDIHKFNSAFVEELEQCEMDPVAMAKCFVNNSCGFEVYTQYCTNYPRTVSVLTELMGNSETAEIFKERQMALQHNLPLGSYLLKPVQRILKYHLLLQNLVKHSEKDSDACIDIRNALSVMTGIAYHINDMKRKHEHAVRVQEIQSLLYGWEGQDLTTYGELVAEGAFRMYRAKALRHLFLFDKMILIAKKKEEGILSYKTHIMCSNLMLIESIQGEPLCFHVIPFDNPRYQYTFQARNLEQKREWCLQLKRVILENYNAVIPSHARQLVMELGQSKLEDSAAEKTTSKRQLSAPEYLEKRKQERRKSEINLKRGFKLKHGSKKGELVPNTKNTTSSRRKCSFGSSNGELSYPRDSWSSHMDFSNDPNSWAKSQDDVNQNENVNQSNYPSAVNGHGSSYNLFSRDTRLRHSLPEPSLSQRAAKKERGFRPSWRAWNSVPEETTDTENEEMNERVSIQRSYRPVARSFESESMEEPYDSSGEYVTFFYAHSYATRDWPENSMSSHEQSDIALDGGNQNQSNANEDMSSRASSPTHQNLYMRNLRESVAADKSNFNDHSKEFIPKDPDSESGSSGYSWKHSAAVRRVQSFTGMAKAKMSSLHHNMSFKHHSRSSNERKLKTAGYQPTSNIQLMPIHSEGSSPAPHARSLPLHEDKFVQAAQKSGSLPRSFQLNTDLTGSSSDTNLALQSEDYSLHRLRLRSDTEKCTYGEPRPFTIASDKPTSADFTDGAGSFILEFSPDADDDYCLLVRRDYREPETTGCTNTPAISMENVNTIHPELKIYHQAASKYSTLKQVFTSMSSKIASLRAAISHPASHDQTDSSLNVSMGDLSRSGMGRSSSRSSVKSDGELGHKILTARFAHSVAKAYSAVVKTKAKKCVIKTKVESKPKKGNVVQTYKSESSLIGARMAHPLESEYSVPKHVIPSHQLQKWKNDLRPDSMFSEYSNATSSDCDKGMLDNHTDSLSKSMKDEAEDSISEASESSADSYYERTFDAIENALAEDMFRDSAIYSDPEDADFSAVELPNLSPDTLEKKDFESTEVLQNGYNMPVQLDLICKRPVNQAILERLRILEENVKCQREEAAAYQKPTFKKRLDIDKWCLSGSARENDESETSSEHSASTVNTVMESGTYIGSENPGMTQCQPRIKGWVKHVVEKLQGEGRV